MRIDLVLSSSIDHTVSFYDDSDVLTPSLFPVAPVSVEACMPARSGHGSRLYRGEAGAACTLVHSEPSPDPCRAVETSSGAPEV